MTKRRTAGSLIVAALSIALGVAGCVGGPPASPSSTPAPDPATALDGRTFLSTALTVDGAAKPLVAGTRVRLGFQGNGLSASAGCNTFGATFRLDSLRGRKVLLVAWASW